MAWALQYDAKQGEDFRDGIVIFPNELGPEDQILVAMQRIIDVEGVLNATFVEVSDASSTALSQTRTETSTETSTIRQQTRSPPPYAPSSLKCMTPVDIDRYDKKRRGFRLRHTGIPDGLYAYRNPDVSPAPYGWLEYHHPEGQSYWLNPEANVVTEANMRNDVIRLKILEWKHQIDALLLLNGLRLPATTELMLQPDEDYESYAMTSDLSTIPFSPSQCRDFLKLLDGIPESDHAQGYRSCVIGKIFSEVYSNYFVNLRGEPNARLCRTQALFPKPQIKSAGWIELLNLLTWGIPAPHHESLQELWVDKIVWSHYWDQYMQYLMYEWKFSAICSAVTTLDLSLQESSSSADALTFVFWVNNLSASAASLFGISSLATSIALIHIHRSPLGVSSASGAGQYLGRAWHKEFGFQPLALLFALPWALLVWALLFLGVRLFISPFVAPPIFVQCAFLTISITLITGLYSILVLLKMAPNPIKTCCQIWRRLTKTARRGWQNIPKILWEGVEASRLKAPSLSVRDLGLSTGDCNRMFGSTIIIELAIC
ncbi:hypothetical protein SISSUDRAFT_1037674 [Sistotremastrum suecicum HHB10207 ss-3]|uniref:WW domain-containing protein n=1 Tax=Sistotremastrum suecicum HHB10207 ss-3 TaxID=1314776 RepID=A0A165XTK4_9AGAM|nr:hypothetical protein SISSUDRAFT_1037674 [Sistotremastrum suecicum HHB10207 ss-3]